MLPVNPEDRLLPFPAQTSKAKWEEHNLRHDDYMARFRALDNNLLDHTAILDSIVSQVSDLNSWMDQYTHSNTTGTTSSTDAIVDAFAAADAAIHTGLNGLVLEVLQSLDRKINSRDHNNEAQLADEKATSPWGRHPRFANMINQWSQDNPYDSDAAYAASWTPQLHATCSSSQITCVRSATGDNPSAIGTCTFAGTVGLTTGPDLYAGYASLTPCENLSAISTCFNAGTVGTTTARYETRSCLASHMCIHRRSTHT